MVWLTIAIISYIILAVTSLIDKILLSGNLSNPKLYAFYIGALSSVALLLLPLGYWPDPSLKILIIGIIAGAAQIYGNYCYLSALKHMEASQVAPVVGGLVPIAGFFLTAYVSHGAAVLASRELAGFVLLIAGSILMMADKKIRIKSSALRSIFMASFLFAFWIVLAKLVYLQLPFVGGFLLMAIGAFGASMTFLLASDVRKTVFGKHSVHSKNKPNLLFLIGQMMGGAAILLQSLAVSQAPQASVPVINALEGVKYIFIFIFSLTLSSFFPSLIKERVGKMVIARKLIAIIFVTIGLSVFALGGI